jgi:GT2 family glycosyltransferase
VTPIRFPHTDRPVASVVLVTYGGWELARRTLDALVTSTGPPFEVVIVDNPTDEDVAERLRDEVEGAEVILNAKNVGFGPAANLGAERARGEHLVFLNTDTIVGPGWLEPLIETLRTDPRAGAAVPRFLNEDGTVQEAGGLLFRDGSTLMYGFRADPADREYLFRRYTDYGSAACLALRRADFQAVGGFDPAYVPAYCEDVDLQLRLRERGLRTVFEPRSEIVHLRFGSTGLTERRAEELVAKNTVILRERWPHVLAQRPPPFDTPGHEGRVLAARDADALERILVVAEDGLPPKLLPSLQDRHPTGRVTVLPVRWRPSDDEVEALLVSGIEVAAAEDPASWLRTRPFHHTAALCPEGYPPPPVARALMEWQPQAPLITVGAGSDPDGLVPDLMNELTAAGILPERSLDGGNGGSIR